LPILQSMAVAFDRWRVRLVLNRGCKVPWASILSFCAVALGRVCGPRRRRAIPSPSSIWLAVGPCSSGRWRDSLPSRAHVDRSLSPARTTLLTPGRNWRRSAATASFSQSQGPGLRASPARRGPVDRQDHAVGGRRGGRFGSPHTRRRRLRRGDRRGADRRGGRPDRHLRGQASLPRDRLRLHPARRSPVRDHNGSQGQPFSSRNPTASARPR